MRSRICISFAAVFALVLAVASIPSHATERRDPLIVPDAQHAPSAKTTSPGHGKAAQKRLAARSAQKQSASSANADKSSQQGGSMLFEGKDQILSENSSGSAKGARSGAGK